jgi:copper chaperone CopZ
MNTINLKIDGMSCAHCVKAVTNALQSATGVSKAEVNLQAGSAHVEGSDLSPETLIKTIQEEGYEAQVKES